MTAWPTLLLALACAPSEPMTLPTSTQDHLVQRLSDSNPGAFYFDRFTTAFGVHLLATDAVSDAQLQHASFVMAEYLDSDEDGAADDPSFVDAMQDRAAAMVLFGSARDLERSGILDTPVLDEVNAQDLYADEILPQGGFDATLEEVLHLISAQGWAAAYPQAFAESSGSDLADAMDRARGGAFDDVPESYPEGAWFHYDDASCDYRCQVAEYAYWATTSILGIQADRCAEIAVEWELCTADQVKDGDVHAWDLLTDGRYAIPTVAPDGDYAAAE